MRVMGIDPGITGAIAVVSPEGLLALHDVPHLKLQRGGKEKKEPDLYELARIIDKLNGDLRPNCAYIERVGAMPQQGVSSVFAFGHVAGILKGVVVGQFIRLEEIPPLRWRTLVGLKSGQDENFSLALAKKTWPTSCGLFSRKMDHNRAEAALIAHAGLKRELAGGAG